MNFHIPWLLSLWFLKMSLLPQNTHATNPFYHDNIKSVKKYSVPDLRSDSFFGYSATYSEPLKSLIVSAPQADAVGQVYSCKIDDTGCNRIRVRESLYNEAESIDETYSHRFWLGATVKSVADLIVVCAPRYLTLKVRDYNWNTANLYGTFGSCYFSKSKLNMWEHLREFSVENITKKIEKDMDTIGWAIDISPEKRIAMGGPGMSTGHAVLIGPLYKYKIPELIDLKDDKTNLSNLNYGYSVEFGNYFTQSPTTSNLAISSTFGAHGQGRVFIFHAIDKKYITYVENTESVGALFGASLCAAILGRRRNVHSLLVGAPTYTPRSNSLEKVYDTGAVYIYNFNSRYEESLARTLLGNKTGGRFGSAIANLGDIDRDGKDDIAIAAPYEDDGKGAVYIYSGADLALTSNSHPQAVQRLQSAGSSAFGLSLAPIKDYDENGCNELMVGAPGSVVGGVDAILVYHCMPQINLTLYYALPSVQELRDRTDRSFFMYKSCFTVDRLTKPTILKGDILVNIRLKHIPGGASFQNLTNSTSLNYTQSLQHATWDYCHNITVYTPFDADYDQLIYIRSTAKLLNSPVDVADFDPRKVLLRADSKLVLEDSVKAAECKDRNKCVPLISVLINTTMPTSTPYVIGSTDNEIVSVLVNNTGEIAYKSCFKVRVRGVRLLSQGGARGASACASVADADADCSLLTYKPNKPIRGDGQWKKVGADIILDTKSLNSESEKNISIEAFAYDSCNLTDQMEDNLLLPSNHTDKIEVNLINDYDGVSLKGNTNPSEVVEVTLDEVKLLGKHVDHVYVIKNNGSTNWVNLKFIINLKKIKYVEFSAPIVPTGNNMDSSTLCDMNMTASEEFDVATCKLDHLKSMKNIRIVVPIYVQMEIWKEFVDIGKLKIDTDLILELDDVHSLNKSVSTSVISIDRKLPWWVILIATLFGILMMLLLTFALYECGFLRRKQKQKLENLQNEFKRQSVLRQSIKSRQHERNSSTKCILEDLESSDEDHTQARDKAHARPRSLRQSQQPQHSETVAEVHEKKHN